MGKQGSGEPISIDVVSQVKGSNKLIPLVSPGKEINFVCYLVVL
jgi:hypothetical protein